MAYLLGFSEFYGQRFFINPDVLIPRPETELLVEMIVDHYKGKVKRVLDVGTGSGVILLSLIGYGVGEWGVGVDLSSAALRVAQINTYRLRLNHKIQFKLSDRLENVEGKFDLIVSNPPYIKKSTQKKLVHKNVDSFEPHTALYLEDEVYLDWFKLFFFQITKHLEGTFFMEGHEDELISLIPLLESLGFESIVILNDFNGRNRFLKANFK